MKQSKVIEPMHSKSAVGYSAFAQDHLANFTSVAGYLIPVYWDFLDPGDKVTLKTLLRTKTAPLSTPAMATCIERIEWFAVPIEQLYKPFSAKFYGINDVSTDLLPTNGYDDYLPYISQQNLSLQLDALPTSFESQAQIPSDVPTYAEAKRLCDALGVTQLTGRNVDIITGSVSALPFAAYQKIYFDHYRLTDREENDPQAYNLDSFVGATGGYSALVGEQARIRKLIMLRKRPYMRDYFTSMYTSPLMGSEDVNASGNDLGNISQWLSGLSRVGTGVPDVTTQLPDGGSLSEVSSNVTNVGNFGVLSSSSANLNRAVSMLNPANIRSLFAVEKLLEVTRRAKKHYDAQTLAHFGVDVPEGLAGECLKIGTHEQYIQIGDVISTSDTLGQDGASLGARAGLGNSEGQSKDFHFEAKCHCVLMAIYSCEPVVNVVNYGTDRRLRMTCASDFYKSEFDNLGMQPVFRYELRQNGYNSTSVTESVDNDVIGWQPRYQQLKSRYNRSFAGCATSFFSDWSLNRENLSDLGAFSRNFFYVWPTDLNGILLTRYQGNLDASNMYSEDYLINQIYFDITKASKKSIYGVPNL